ncbi:MAG: FAD-dependent oxidoreductase [Thermoleophilia bacterium]
MSTTPEAEVPLPFYDVIVVGAGPSGAEAALAAARAGAHTLCLTINLDTVGFPPATPVLIENRDDIRTGMFSEMQRLGALLPGLATAPGVVMEAAAGPDDFAGRLVVDRRRLGLAYKEALETAANLELRQSLVTSLSRGDQDQTTWLVTTGLAEQFRAGAVVIAAGTFLGGMVDDAGGRLPGGRKGEIPSLALAARHAELGLSLVTAPATTNPRLDCRSFPPETASRTGSDPPALVPDGSQLDESMAPGLWPQGDRLQQLDQVRQMTGQPTAWMTRASYSVDHRVLAGGELLPSLQTKALPGLFFAGRAAGSCNYAEAAMLGLVAGAGAAAVALGQASPLSQDTIYVDKLCRVIAEQESRPATIRITGPGC